VKLLLLDAAGAAARRRVLLLDMRDEQSFAACHVDGGRTHSSPDRLKVLPVARGVLLA